jgi:hypothetical protein
MPPRRARTALATACLLSLAGCARHVQRDDPRWQGRGRECVRPFVGRDSPYAELASRQEDEAILASVPPEASRTMRAARLSTMVARALAAEPSAKPTLETVLTRQELGMRLISLETQLAAVIFEAECTGELIEAMTFELEDRSDLRDLRLALASLLVGAASATAAGVWDLMGTQSNGPAVLALSGGVISAGVGGAAFVKRPQALRYHHARNLLRPLYLGRDDDELYPQFVFNLLVLPEPDGGPSPRERLLARFRELVAESVPSGERARAEALLYGAGGVYGQELLALRERLYDALESELNAQARDLELLDRFLVRALERNDDAPSER